MKKSLLLLSFLIMTIVSCKQQNNSEIIKTAPISYEKIGVLHNEGLELFITNVKNLSNFTKGGLSSVDKSTIVDVKNSVIKNVITQLFENSISDLKIQSMIGATTKTTLNNAIQEVKDELSDLQKQFSEELESIIYAEMIL